MYKRLMTQLKKRALSTSSNEVPSHCKGNIRAVCWVSTGYHVSSDKHF